MNDGDDLAFGRAKAKFKVNNLVEDSIETLPPQKNEETSAILNNRLIVSLSGIFYFYKICPI